MRTLIAIQRQNTGRLPYAYAYADTGSHTVLCLAMATHSSPFLPGVRRIPDGLRIMSRQ